MKTYHLFALIALAWLGSAVHLASWFLFPSSTSLFESERDGEDTGVASQGAHTYQFLATTSLNNSGSGGVGRTGKRLVATDRGACSERFWFSLPSTANENSCRSLLPHLHVPYGTWAHSCFVVIPHQHHGDALVRQVVREGEEEEAAGLISTIVLDYGWWDPSDVFSFHPDLYPHPSTLLSSTGAKKKKKNRGDAQGYDYDDNKHLLVWVSALIPTHDKRYNDWAKSGYFLRTSSPSSAASASSTGEHVPVVVTWEHTMAPAIQGSLVDFTNPRAVAALKQALRTSLFAQCRHVHGFRLGGVDALLIGANEGHRGKMGRRAFFTHNGSHVEKDVYSHLYYTTMLNIGRGLSGSDLEFLVVSRPVDSYGKFAFQQFAPQDVSFAAMVGDHPFSFAGFREAAVNAIHSSYRGYLNVGSMVGGGIGSFDQIERNSQDLQRYFSRRRHDVNLAPEHPEEVPSRTGEGSTTEEEEGENDLRNRQRRRQQAVDRAQQLYVRWLQYSSALPFLSIVASPPTSKSAVAGTRDGKESAVFPRAVNDRYRETVLHAIRRHRLLAPYFAALATSQFHKLFLHMEPGDLQQQQTLRSSASNFARVVGDVRIEDSDDEGQQEGEKDSALPWFPRQLAASWVVRPLAHRRVHFEVPDDGAGAAADWAFLVGAQLFSVPVMKSCGALTTIDVDFRVASRVADSTVASEKEPPDEDQDGKFVSRESESKKAKNKKKKRCWYMFDSGITVKPESTKEAAEGGGGGLNESLYGAVFDATSLVRFKHVSTRSSLLFHRCGALIPLRQREQLVVFTARVVPDCAPTRIGEEEEEEESDNSESASAEFSLPMPSMTTIVLPSSKTTEKQQQEGGRAQRRVHRLPWVPGTMKYNANWRCGEEHAKYRFSYAQTLPLSSSVTSTNVTIPSFVGVEVRVDDSTRTNGRIHPEETGEPLSCSCTVGSSRSTSAACTIFPSSSSMWDYSSQVDHDDKKEDRDFSCHYAYQRTKATEGNGGFSVLRMLIQSTASAECVCS